MSTRFARRGLVLAGVLTALMSVQADLGTAQAQSSQSVTTTSNFDIPAGALQDSLNAFSRQTGISVVLGNGVSGTTPTLAVRGNLTAPQALASMLSSSALTFQFLDAKAVSISAMEANAQSGAVVLPAVTVEGVHSVAQAMPGISFAPGDSGLTTFGESSIRAMSVGERDPMKLLRVSPNINWDNAEYKVDGDSEQDLTPAHVSISGGRVYENAVYLNGLSNRSADEYSNGSDSSGTGMPVGNALAVFPHTNTLEEVAAYDSNVPAEYSGFTGGVIEMRTKRPDAERKAWIAHSLQRSEWAEYERVGDPDTDPSRYRKYSSEAGWSGAIGETTNLMIAASRVTAETERRRSDNYGGGSLGMTETNSDNIQVALNQKIGDKWMANLQGSYMPYTRHYMVENRLNGGEITTEGRGTNLSADFDYAGNNLDANIKLGYTKSGYERDAPDTFYQWNMSTPSAADLCADVSASNCQVGGYGDIYTQQEDFQLRGKISSDLIGVKWTSGLDFKSTIATRGRNSEAVAYLSGNPPWTVTCTPGDPSCLNNEQYSKTKMTYLPYSVEEDMNSYGLYLQGEKRINLGNDWVKALDIRAGVRGDYDDYQRNYNIAPRLSATAELPNKMALTVGANRYYSAGSLVYALRASEGLTSRTETRTSYTSPWTTRLEQGNTFKVPNGLETPYSDEGTIALTSPVGNDGKARLKYVKRNTRNEFTRSYDVPGSTKDSTLENGGWTKYQSASLEYEHTYKNNAFLFGLSWSDTERAGLDYDFVDDADFDGTTPALLRSQWGYYNGQVVKRNVIRTFASNMAQPWVFNFAWASHWMEDKLKINVNGKYRFARPGIDQTGTGTHVLPTGQTVTLLPEYEDSNLRGHWRADANISYQIDTWEKQSFEVFLNIENIFDGRTYTYGQPEVGADDDGWEKGRTFWVGGRYNF